MTDPEQINLADLAFIEILGNKIKSSGSEQLITSFNEVKNFTNKLIFENFNKFVSKR